jgi:hypothetical protein
MIKTANAIATIVPVSSVTPATSWMKTVSVSLPQAPIKIKLIIASSTGTVTPKESGITTGSMDAAKSVNYAKKATTSMKILPVSNFLKTAKKSMKKVNALNVSTTMNLIGTETVSKLSLPPTIIIAKLTSTSTRKVNGSRPGSLAAKNSVFSAVKGTSSIHHTNASNFHLIVLRPNKTVAARNVLKGIN